MGLINNKTRQIRLEIVENRNSNTIKNIIINYIPKGNIIITDGAFCYQWLNDPSNDYVHSVHSHGHGDFCYGLDSTSHIESFWPNLKSIIKSIYTVISCENFSFFQLGEAEFRRNIKNLILKILHPITMIFLNMLMMYMMMKLNQFKINILLLYYLAINNYIYDI